MFKFLIFGIFLIDIVFSLPNLNFGGNSVQIQNLTSCSTGETFVHESIFFECLNSNGIVELRPIACVPENDRTKIVQAGQFYSTEHFKYQCVEEGTSLALKITNCIDSTGMVVEIGRFFTMMENGIHITTECFGDNFNAKKTVHQWTKCTLSNGKQITEGNFHVESIIDADKPILQKGEIISCIRENKQVGLKCTGCVTEFTSIHLGVSGYVQVHNQWVQCRRFGDKCRLVNVTQNYVDCKLTGSEVTYQNGVYFNDTKGVSTYYCNHGIASKHGCVIDGKWALVGEVIYTDAGEAFLCDTSRTGFTSFNSLKGCVASDGSPKRFQEVWQEGQVMKRCSWIFGPNGIVDSRILSYACVRGTEIVPEHKIVQKKNGIYEKCAKDVNGELGIRSLTPSELAEHIKRKTLRLDLIEYFANGGKGALETLNLFDDGLAAISVTSTPSTVSSTLPSTHPSTISSVFSTIESKTAKIASSIVSSTVLPFLVDESATTNANVFVKANENSCVDLVPFCFKLTAYCPDFEKYQIIDGEVAQNPADAILNIHDFLNTRPVSPCEALFMTHQKKLKLLVEVICPRTCNSCLKPEEADRIIDRLQTTSRCG